MKQLPPHDSEVRSRFVRGRVIGHAGPDSIIVKDFASGETHTLHISQIDPASSPLAGEALAIARAHCHACQKLARRTGNTYAHCEKHA